MRGPSFSRIAYLLLLSASPRTGYELIKESEKLIGRKPSSGEVYPFLERMLKEGYLKMSKKDGKKIYSLTKRGASAVSEIIRKSNLLVSELIGKKIRKCAHCGCVVLGTPVEKTVNSKKKVFCCIYCYDAYEVKS